MPRFEIKVRKEPTIEAPKFRADQMKEIADFAVQVIKERDAKGFDVLDQPSKPLQPKYAKRKAAKGLPAVRDERFTGNMLGAIHVTEADETHAKIKIEGATPQKKAIFTQNIDPWYGLSDNDQSRVLNEKVRPIFAQNIEDAFK